MSGHVDVIGTAASVVVAVMVVTWLISLPRCDVSIVDIAWGLGFVAATGAAWAVGDGDPARSNLLLALVAIWGLRLAGHLAVRNLGHGEDRRYAAMRRRVGPSFAVRSLVTVFGFQGVVMVIVASPVLVAMTPTEPEGLGVLAVVGTVVWGVGFVFEAVGDAQLARFKADPDNEGEVMDRGLWRYTRHPNYFGDALVWWGIWLVAAETTDARWAVVGPIVMTVLLRRVSGVTLLERSLRRRRAGYDDYVARTSPFVPRPPRRAGAGSTEPPGGAGPAS